MNDTEKEKAKLNKIKQVQQAGAISLFSEAIKEKEIEDFSVESVNSTKADTILLVNVKGNNVLLKVSANVQKWISEVPKIVDALSDESKTSLEIFDALMSTKLPPLETPVRLLKNLKLKPNKNGKVRFFTQGLIQNLYDLYVEDLELVGVTEIEKKKYMAYMEINFKLKSLIIAEGLKKIGEEALSFFTKLESVSLPDSLTEIGRDIFRGCDSLTSMRVPKNMTSFDENLKHVYLSDAVTKINDWEFLRYHSLESVKLPKGLKGIGCQAFKYCNSLKSIRIPKSVERMEFGVFLGCTALSDIEFDGTVEQWKQIKIGAGWHDGGPAKVVKCTDGEWIIPDYYIVNGKLTEWLDTSAESVTIPDGVTTICANETIRSAFFKCKALKSVEISSCVKKILKYAFTRCDCLESVVMREGVEKIEKSAFLDCKALKYIEIPSTMKSMCKESFSGCGAVEKIVSHSPLFPFDEKTGRLYDATGSKKKVVLTLMAAKKEAKKNKIAKLRDAVLESIVGGHRSKVSFVRKEDSSYLRINSGNGGIEVLLADYAVSKWSKTLPALLDFAETGADAAALKKYALDNGFKDASPKYFSVKNRLLKGNSNKNPVYLFIGGSARTIGKRAFEACKLLKTVEIASGLRKIEDYAFLYCHKLESVKIPETVMEIGEFVFFDCESLSSIEFGGTVAQWKELTEKKEKLLIFSSVKSVKCSDGECRNPVHLMVQNTDEKPQGFPLGYDETKIPEDFFAGQKSAEYIRVPEGITEIGARAFKNCTMKSIILPSTLTKIDDSAFEGCPNLRVLQFHLGLKKIGERAFFGCWSLKRILFHGSEKLWRDIEKGADWNEGTKIKDIDCVGFDNLKIENGVVTDCKKDAVVVRVPENAIKISSEAFKDCVCLKHVAFYPGVTEIGNNAFQDCTSLETILFVGTKKQWEGIRLGTDWQKNIPAKVVH
ncbi:MAG: leucine-rich repeat domain-containing protein, partial [Treponema sp.]|nr:leucine-rich repeat domain-containing protein [Treponema sp.]